MYTLYLYNAIHITHIICITCIKALEFQLNTAVSITHDLKKRKKKTMELHIRNREINKVNRLDRITCLHKYFRYIYMLNA